MDGKGEKQGFLARLSKAEKRRLAGLLSILAIVSILAYRLFHPADPLAELRRTEAAVVAPEAQNIIDKALAFIREGNYGRNGLFSLMASRDFVMYQVDYTDEATGLFSARQPSFTPFTVLPDARRKVHSSFPHVFVRLHSVPRQEDYWIAAVKFKHGYRIDSICKVP